MNFEKSTIYHIYNQGNNHQKIFFHDKNYLFFLEKMRQFLLPYGDMLCYCLMPNHFHWLFYARETILEFPIENLAQKDSTDFKQRTLNESIGILLRSYTRAINIQENRTGALFREETKAKDGWEGEFLSRSHPDFTKKQLSWDIYGHTSFHYIHENPKVAKLVLKAEDWSFSSCMDYLGLRNGTLCNKELARELLRIPKTW